MPTNARPTTTPATTQRGGLLTLLVAGGAGLILGYGIEISGATALALRHELDRSALAPGALVSIVLAFAALGALLGGWFADRSTRRSAMFSGSLIVGFGAILGTAGFDAAVIDVGRAVIAFGVGSLSASVAIAVAEVASPARRGATVILVPLGAVVGLGLAFVADLFLGATGAWRAIFGLAIALAGGLGVLAWRWPRTDTAVAARASEHPGRALGVAGVRPALALVLVLALGQQLTGIDVLVGRARSLFTAISVTPDSANVWAAISIGFFSLMAILLARHHIDHDGRRKLLRVGLPALAASLLALTILTLLTGDERSELTDYAAIPVMWAAVFAFALTLGSTGWVLISEIVPSGARGTSSGVAYALRWLAALLVALTTRPLAEAFGDATVFALSAVASVAVLIVARRVPETMGVPLAEINVGGERATTSSPDRSAGAAASAGAHGDAPPTRPNPANN